MKDSESKRRGGVEVRVGGRGGPFSRSQGVRKCGCVCDKDFFRVLSCFRKAHIPLWPEVMKCILK